MNGVPYIAWSARQEGDDPGYWVGTALDDLVVFAKEQGATDDALHERLEQALDAAEARFAHRAEKVET